MGKGRQIAGLCALVGVTSSEEVAKLVGLCHLKGFAILGKLLVPAQDVVVGADNIICISFDELVERTSGMAVNCPLAQSDWYNVATLWYLFLSNASSSRSAMCLVGLVVTLEEA